MKGNKNMKLVKPEFVVEDKLNGHEIIQEIASAARTCYKSISAGDEKAFISRLLNAGHHAMLEFGPSITVRFIVDRGVSHELVRHRLCSFAQESTRYCNYKGGVTFVIPPWVEVTPGKYDRQVVMESFKDY